MVYVSEITTVTNHDTSHQVLNLSFTSNPGSRLVFGYIKNNRALLLKGWQKLGSMKTVCLSSGNAR